MTEPISVSDLAREQIKLMLENDFTLEDKVLRISVDGKGCDGFDFAIGFTGPDEKDILHHIGNITIHLDPFVAEHLTHFTIDYATDFENDQEGFVITNHQKDKTKGKFWLKK